jgi:cytochrome c-type biogenesis protein CcmH/NrfF
VKSCSGRYEDPKIAGQLRTEIETRVGRGESTAAVESDLVARYGPRIRAMPDRAAFATTTFIVMVMIALGLVAAVVLVRRWRLGPERVTPALAPQGSSPCAADQYDTQLDEELRSME